MENQHKNGHIPIYNQPQKLRFSAGVQNYILFDVAGESSDVMMKPENNNLCCLTLTYNAASYLIII